MASYSIGFSPAAFYSQQVTDGATNRWKMDAASGNMTDDIGGVLATVHGSPTYQQQGLFGANSAILFNTNGGGGNYFTLGSCGSSATWTIEWWSFLNREAQDQPNLNNSIFLSSSIDASNYIRIIERTGQTGGVYVQLTLGGASTLMQLGSGGNVNVWTHWAIVRNGTTVTAYRNGVSIGSMTVGSGANALGGYMGSEAGANALQGKLDDLAVYSSTALTAAQVLQHFMLGPELASGGDNPTRATTPTRTLYDRGLGRDERENLIASLIGGEQANASNPSFEIDTSGWVGYWSGTGVRVADAGATGSWAMEVTTVSGNGRSDGVSYRLPDGLETGDYVMSFWAKSVSGPTSLQVAIEGAIVVGPTSVTLTTSWQRFSLAWTVTSWQCVPTSAPQPPPASSRNAKFRFVEPTDGAQMVFRIDGIQLERGTTLNAYTETRVPLMGRTTVAARTSGAPEWADGQDTQFKNWIPSDLAASLGHYASANGTGIASPVLARNADAPSGLDVTVPGSAAFTGTSSASSPNSYMAVMPFTTANALTDGMPVTPGQRVFLSAFYKIAQWPAGGAGGVVLYLATWDSSGAFLTYTQVAAQTVVTNGQWTQISGWVTIPAGTAAYAGMRVQLFEPGLVGNLAAGAWEFRTAGYYIGDKPSSFFSGTSGAGGTWVGTSEASPATKGAVSPTRAYTGTRTRTESGLGVEGGTNLLGPGVDVSGEGVPSLAGWITFAGGTGSTGARQRDDTWSTHGSASLRFTGTLGSSGYVEGSIYSRGADQNLADLQTYAAPVIPGQQYTARCDYRQNVAAGSGPQLYIRWHDATGVSTGTQASSSLGSTTAGATGTLTATGTAPAGARYATVLLVAEGGATATVWGKTVDVSFDAVGLYAGASAPSPYDYARPLARATVATRAWGEGALSQDEWRNLSTNPSLETDATGWAHWFGTDTVARDTTLAGVGTASYKVTKTVSTENWNGVLTAFNLQSETPMSAGFWFRTSAAFTGGVQLRNGPSTFVAQTATQAWSANTWYWISLLNWTAPANKVLGQMVLAASRTDAQNFATGDSMWFDGVVIVPGPTLPTGGYFDGGTDPNARWLGTTNDSSSALLRIARATVAARQPSADSASGTDTLARITIGGRTITDTGSGADTWTRSTTVARAPVDNGLGADSPTRAGVFARADTASGSGVESLARVTIGGRELADTGSGADTWTRWTAVARTPSDPGAGTDGVGWQGVYARAGGDSAPAVCDTTRWVWFPRTTTDDANGADTPLPGRELPPYARVFRIGVARDQLINPATGEQYVWPINHKTEEQSAKRRHVELIQPTAGGWQQVPAVKQQGAEGPWLMRLGGVISDSSQHEAFLNFWRLSASQTVHFVHCDGSHYEVLITNYQPQRSGVVRAVRGGGDHEWTYTLEMEIVAQLA